MTHGRKPGAFVSFLALALDFEHLTFVPCIKSKEMLSKQLNSWPGKGIISLGSVLFVAFSVCKSNQSLLLKVLIAFPSSLSHVTVRGCV